MIERARESDEVLAKQIEYLASVLSSIEHCREEEEDDEKKEKFETNEEVEVEGIGKYYGDENNNESDDWADDNTSYWWREEQKSGGEVRILERRRKREVESNGCSDPKEERKHLESLITRIRALRMRAESIGRQVA